MSSQPEGEVWLCDGGWWSGSAGEVDEGAARPSPEEHWPTQWEWENAQERW